MNNQVVEAKITGYVYKRGSNKWSFLNRWDQLIKIFPSEKQARKFAGENISLVDKYIKGKVPVDLFEPFDDEVFNITSGTKNYNRIVKPSFEKDHIQIWGELDSEDPQVVFIRRDRVKQVIEVLSGML